MKLRWNFAQRNCSRIIVNRYYEFLPQIQNSTYVRSLTNRPIFRIFSCHRAPRIYRCRTKEDKEAKEEKGGAGDRNRNDDCTIASNSTRERCKAVIVVDRGLIHLYIYIYMIIDSRIGSTKTRYCWKTQFDNFDDNWDTLAIQLEHLARQKLRVVNLSFASVTATFRKSGDKRQIVRNCSS